MKIYLIPTPLAEENFGQQLPPIVPEVVAGLSYFLVENVRTARRFISSLALGRPIDQLHFGVLDKDSSVEDLKKFFNQVPQNQNIGIMSEAGCPGVADPGALAVAYAHQMGMEVVPLVGASSILLALMASGFNGQRFAFHGYLPIEKTQKSLSIKQLEQESLKKNQTQIFIETPFRNGQLMQDFLTVCQPTTRLCVACALTSPDEYIRTLSIKDWKNTKVDLHKKPTVFLLMA